MKKRLFLLPLILALLVSGTVEAKKKKYSNGDYYEGEWKKGTPNGKGKMTYANGDIYVGQWIFGEIEGQGSMTYKNGDYYEGKWKKGEYYGKGLLKSNGVTYEGIWNSEYFKGKCETYIKSAGIFIYFDGCIANNTQIMDGTIRYKFDNGTTRYFATYTGKAKNLQEMGKGEMVFDKYNTKISGEWNNGILVKGDGTLESDSQTYKFKIEEKDPLSYNYTIQMGTNPIVNITKTGKRRALEFIPDELMNAVKYATPIYQKQLNEAREREFKLQIDFYNTHLKSICYALEIPFSQLKPDGLFFVDTSSMQCLISIIFKDGYKLQYNLLSVVDVNKLHSHDETFLSALNEMSTIFTTNKEYEYRIQDGCLIFDKYKLKFDSNYQRLLDKKSSYKSYNEDVFKNEIEAVYKEKNVEFFKLLVNKVDKFKGLRWMITSGSRKKSIEKKGTKETYRKEEEEEEEKPLLKKEEEPAKTKIKTSLPDQPASFPGGKEELRKYLGKNIKYPTIAQENGATGRVLVQFTVTCEGAIKDVKVERSVDPYLDKEAMRVVYSMPKWEPAVLNGEFVDSTTTVTIAFGLN